MTTAWQEGGKARHYSISSVALIRAIAYFVGRDVLMCPYQLGLTGWKATI